MLPARDSRFLQGTDRALLPPAPEAYFATGWHGQFAGATPTTVGWNIVPDGLVIPDELSTGWTAAPSNSFASMNLKFLHSRAAPSASRTKALDGANNVVGYNRFPQASGDQLLDSAEA